MVDASLALRATLAGFEEILEVDDELVAPPLLWSEARSLLHAPRKTADTAASPNELGWGKTYDAEFCALASILDCRLVTVDARLRRGADRLGFVVGPTEL